MKQIVCLIAMAYWMNTAYAQTVIEQLVPLKSNQKISMDFTWPELVTIESWEGKEVKLIATISINKGQNDDAFSFDVNTSGSEVSIVSIIKNHDKLPKKIQIFHSGQEYFFDTDKQNSAEIKKFKKEKGIDGFEYMSFGVIKKISVQILVPRNVALDVYSKYGLIEVMGEIGSLTVHSKFGGVDLSTSGQFAIKAGTRFGEKYTNLEAPIKTITLGTNPGKWDWVQVGKPDQNIVQELKSDFGNIYIRKM